MKLFLALLSLSVMIPTTALAQFVGPTPTGRTSTVEQARNARVDTYVAVTGNIVAHLREDYYTFRDETGDIRVEIQDSVWQGRQVDPETKVRLVGEVDRTVSGMYLWVEALEIVK